MHRIPYKRNETSGAEDRPVVFLMHGLLGASHNYIMLGPEYAIAYNLADAGFDVWMGNARGNRNSRQHVTMDPDNPDDRKQFFDFTWEQIGYYDVASMIDYILNHTNNQKLHYVGHSQGGTAFLVLNSMRTEYNDKIISAHLLAGVGYMTYFPNRILRPLAMFTNTIYSLALRMRVVEIFPPRRNVANSTDNSNNLRRADDYEVPHGEKFDYDCDKDRACRIVDLCTGDINQKEICELLGLEEIMPAEMYDSMMTEFEIGGASLKQFAHYGQNIQDSGLFRRWNYGNVDNFLKYGSQEPPIYDISLITIPTTMHYTVNDNLLDERDVLAMCAVIPNCKERKVARTTFEHADFVAARDVKELVTDYMIEQLLEAHKNYLMEQENLPLPEAENLPSISTTILAPYILIASNLSVLILYLFVST
ncbi:alpha/beta hydrolase fold domain-containing protein [Phthorimaea operculella]|nr:alpha/beta hydrolase fold domain-containing protein [Phthorimaea operculella]